MINRISFLTHSLPHSPKVKKKLKKVGNGSFWQHRMQLPCPFQNLRHFISVTGIILHQLLPANHPYNFLAPRKKVGGNQPS